MNRTRWLLVVILLELAVGSYLVYRRAARTIPPRPDVSDLEPITAADLREFAIHCETPAEWARLAECYFANGFVPEAEACYREAARSGDAEQLFRHAFLLDRLGLVEEAIVQFRAAIAAEHPRSLDAWYYIGRNYLRVEQAGLAEEAFSHCGDHPAAQHELSLLKFREGKVEETLAIADRLAKRFPASQQPVSVRYRVAVSRGDRVLADRLADRFDRALFRLPNPLDTESDWLERVRDRYGVRQRVRGAMQAGKTATAEAALEEAMKNAWTPEVADLYSDVLLQRGQKAEAVKMLEAAIQRDGPSVQLVWRLGQCYEVAGRAADGRATLTRVARYATGPELKDLLYRLSTAQEKAGEKELANQTLSRAYLVAAGDRLERGYPQDAIPALQEALQLNPQLAHAWYRLGEAHRATLRLEDAKVAYEKCLAIDPYHGRAIRAMSTIK